MTDMPAPTPRKLSLGEVFSFAHDGKIALLKTGKSRGHRICPGCGGNVRFWLAGPRKHLRMACETPGCNMRCME